MSSKLALRLASSVFKMAESHAEVPMALSTFRSCSFLLSRTRLLPRPLVSAFGSRFCSQVATPTGAPPASPMHLPYRPWKNPETTSAACFNQQYPTEYRKSAIEGAGMGWWAKVDIPAGVHLRTSSVEDGSFFRFASEEELRSCGWEVDEAVHYGISLNGDPDVTYFSNPGIPCNHADPSRKPSVEYKLVRPGLMEVWTISDIKAGDEILTDYTKCFTECEWYDKLVFEHGLIPVGKIGHLINEQQSPVE